MATASKDNVKLDNGSARCGVTTATATCYTRCSRPPPPTNNKQSETGAALRGRRVTRTIAPGPKQLNLLSIAVWMSWGAKISATMARWSIGVDVFRFHFRNGIAVECEGRDSDSVSETWTVGKATGRCVQRCMCCMVLAAFEHCYWALVRLLYKDERQRAIGARRGPDGAASTGPVYIC